MEKIEIVNRIIYIMLNLETWMFRVQSSLMLNTVKNT